jgi:hypothetical protein
LSKIPELEKLRSLPPLPLSPPLPVKEEREKKNKKGREKSDLLSIVDSHRRAQKSHCTDNKERENFLFVKHRIYFSVPLFLSASKR